MRIVRGGCVVAALLALSGAGRAAAQSTPPRITFDPATTHQTMDGWEATLDVGEFLPSYSQWASTALRKIVEDVGINRIRLEIRAGAENTRRYWKEWQDGDIPYETWRAARYSTVDDDGDPDVIDWDGFQFDEIDAQVQHRLLPIKTHLEDRGEKLQVNLAYVAFTGQISGSGRSYHHDDPAEYAEFLLATCIHLRDTWDIVPDTVQIMLEPDNTSQWSGNLVGRALVAAKQRLSAEGFTFGYVAPSTTSMHHAWEYFDEMKKVSGATDALTELSYHRYVGVSQSHLQAIVDRAATYGLKTAMLEHFGSTHHALHEDLTLGNNSSWQQYAVAYNDDHGGTYLVVDESGQSPVVNLAFRTRFLRLYFLWVRQGAVRVKATSTDGALEPLGFVNADGRPTVVVKADGSRSFEIAGLPAGTYGIRYATESQESVDRTDVHIDDGGVVAASIPAEGVITVYAKSLDVAPAPVEAPEIVASSPQGAELTLVEGESQAFGVTAQDPQDLDLTYAWTVDGASAGSGASSFSWTAAGTGEHAVVVTVANSEQQVQRSWNVLVTAVPAPPEVAVTAPTSAAEHLTGAATLDLGGTASDADGIATVSWSNDRGGGGDASGTTAWTAPAVELLPGINVLTVTATDATGLSTAVTLRVQRDAQDPSVAFTTPPPGAEIVTTATTAALAGIASDDSGVDAVTWSSDRGASGTADGTTGWSVADVPLEAGRNEVTVEARDLVGRRGTSVVALLRDTGPPEVTVTAPSATGAFSTFAPSVVVEGTAADDLGVAAVAWANDRGGSGAATSPSAWTTGPIALADGENLLTVTATDRAGRTAVATIVVTRNDPTPSVAVTSPAATASFATSRPVVLLGGNAAAALGLASVTWSDGRGNSGAAGGTTSWTASVPVEPGANPITLTATDAEGHAGTATVTVDFRPASLRLVPGYNLVSLPSAPDAPYLASAFVAAAAAAGADPLAVIDPSAGDSGTYTAAGAGQDFPLVPGRAYFVRCRKAAVVPIAGDALADGPVTIPLRRGVNFVGLPVLAAGPRSAAAVAADVEADGGSVLSIQRWKDGATDPFVPGRGAEGFELLPGEGFVLVCGRDSAWEARP